MSNAFTTDQKQEMYRKMAAATVRQLATVLKELRPNLLEPRLSASYAEGANALEDLATRIEIGRLNPRRYEFLTWLDQPKVNIDSLELPVISVEAPLSGSKKNAANERSPSTPPP